VSAMAGTCPTCQRSFDPVRAAVVRVVGTRVVSYCSSECADRPASVPAPVAAAPPPRVADPIRAPSAPAADEPFPLASEVPATTLAGWTPDAPSSSDARRRRRRQVVALCAATIAGGMAIAVIEAVSPSTPSRVDAATSAPVVGEGAGAPRPPSPAELQTRAVATLRQALTSPSPRVRRVAATALARTRDPAALAALAVALGEEDSEIARLDIAYALGRGGDPRGVAALEKALSSSPRKDVKAEAARLLLELGDSRGLAFLHTLLATPQQRLSAAEVLATAGDSEGLAALESVRSDSAASEEERLRAAVALGRAGKADVPGLVDQLRAALDRGRFNVGAAAALARLGDERAVPALEAQLTVQSLQVGAAVSLRRLRPKLDPAPLLPPLAAALGADKDLAAVSAAEAILLLTGPAELAERD